MLHENTSHCQYAIFAKGRIAREWLSTADRNLEADHDTDHVIAVYRVDAALGRSREIELPGCRYRPEPVYRTLRELALSYFSQRSTSICVRNGRYGDSRVPQTLRASQTAYDWMTPPTSPYLAHRLPLARHQARHPLFSKRIANRLHRVDERVYRAEILGKSL